MNGGTGNFLLEKAEAFALRIKPGYPEDVPVTQSLLADCDELIRLLASSIKTARSKS